MLRFLEFILAWLLKRTAPQSDITLRETVEVMARFAGYRPAPAAILATRRHAHWARFNKPPRSHRRS